MRHKPVAAIIIANLIPVGYSVSSLKFTPNALDEYKELIQDTKLGIQSMQERKRKLPPICAPSESSNEG